MFYDIIYVVDYDELPLYLYDSLKSIKKKEKVILHLILNENHYEKVLSWDILSCFYMVFVSQVFEFKKREYDFRINFRNQFFEKTIQRFDIIKNYMSTRMNSKIDIVFHTECDVYFQTSFDNIYRYVKEKDKIYACRDAPNRIIASLLYIPNYESLIPFLEFCDEKLGSGYFYNDMQLLSMYGNINSFPTEPNTNKIIFDAAAFGQCLFGIDPRNSNGMNTIGFVNETSSFKPDYSKFHINNGFICYDNNVLGIIHMHCKNFSLIKEYLKN